MSEPAKIFTELEKLFSGLSAHLPLAGVNVLVTSGPTRSYLDPVRFLTNRSSGRMGHAIASTAERLGANVTLVTGPVEPRFALLDGGTVKKVETSGEMADAVGSAFAQADLVFATAAVVDFEAPQVSEQKLARKGALDLHLQATRDVIGEVAKKKTDKQILVGFAAEVGSGEDSFTKARDKLVRKNLDLLALNDVSRSDIGFDSPDNQIFLFSKTNKQPEAWQKITKTQLAEQLLLKAYSLWQQQQ
jgi:phosphopantothenoylcysteine decarboxylase/phosphopantothenate--cysteine ligase